MTGFSAINSFYNAAGLLKHTSGDRIATKAVQGGGFNPDTKEALQIMRTEMENQFEKGFIIKYKAMLTNRLNRIVQDLKNSYQALLYNTMVQDVGENSTGVATDYRGNPLPAAGGAKVYKGIGIGSDTAGGTSDDGINSFDGSSIFGRNVEMRRFMSAGPAMDMYNDLKITFRSQEKEPKPGSWLEDLSFLGDNPKPFEFHQKIAEYATTVKSGGFFTTLNYLYNFSPRSIKYTYATAYTANTSEAGSRNITGGAFATLFNRKKVDERDATSQDVDAQGDRLQWTNTNTNEGYLTEKDTYSDVYGRMAHFHNRDTSGLELGNNPTEATKTFGVSSGTNIISGTIFISKDNYEANTLYTNHYQVLSQTIGYNMDGSGMIKTDAPDIFGSGSTRYSNILSSGGQTVWESSGIDATLDYSNDINNDGSVNVDDEVMPGSGKISKFFTNKFVNEIHRIEEYNGKDVVGNFESPYLGNVEITKFEGTLRAVAMSKGATEYEPPELWEINASTAIPTDWYQAEANVNSIWFPYVAGSAFDETGTNSYKDQTVNLRKAFEVTEQELKMATTIPVEITSDDNAYLMINGKIFEEPNPSPPPDKIPINITSGNPKTVDIKPYLRAGVNVIAVQVSHASNVAPKVEGVSIMPGVTAPSWALDKISTAAAPTGLIKGEDKMSTGTASFWQSQIVTYKGVVPAVPDADEAKYISDPKYTGTALKRKATGDALNPFALVLMEAINDLAKHQDIFKLGLFKDIVVVGTANTPAGGTVSASVSLDYDMQTRRISMMQNRFVAKQG